MITLITGGIKSGKSSFALKLSKSYKAKAFVATGIPFDEEMKKRISKHKKERHGKGFDTYEEPIKVYEVLQNLNSKYDVVIFDCLTTYLGNLFFYEKNIDEYIDKLIETIKKIDYRLIIVTNEVGWGIIPENKLARKFAEVLGNTNKKIAKIADEVYLMISGIGVKIK